MARRIPEPPPDADEVPGAPPARRARRRSFEDDVGTRVQANRAAFAAIQTLRIIRGYFVAYAVLCGLVALFTFLNDGSGVTVSVALVLMAVSIAGALLVVQQPLVWTVVNAVLATPILAVTLWNLLLRGVDITG